MRPDARLEQERLKAQMAWRNIDKAEAENLKTALAIKPMKVTIRHPAGDAEAGSLSIRFRQYFCRSEMASWNVRRTNERIGRVGRICAGFT